MCLKGKFSDDLGDLRTSGVISDKKAEKEHEDRNAEDKVAEMVELESVPIAAKPEEKEFAPPSSENPEEKDKEKKDDEKEAEEKKKKEEEEKKEKEDKGKEKEEKSAEDKAAEAPSVEVAPNPGIAEHKLNSFINYYKGVGREIYLIWDAIMIQSDAEILDKKGTEQYYYLNFQVLSSSFSHFVFCFSHLFLFL
jgi:hypothetical protein